MIPYNKKWDEWGYNEHWEKIRSNNGWDSYSVGRIAIQHREKYIIQTDKGEYTGEVLGNLLYSVESTRDLPCVGDWVVISEYDEGKAIIHNIFPRYSLLERQAVGKKGEKQIIATNIDYGIIVQSLNRDFNLNRIERYVSLCHSANIQPILVITKIDLFDKDFIFEKISGIKNRFSGMVVYPLSNDTKEGLSDLEKAIENGKTYCLLGSSGVGKSSIINSLLGDNLMATGSISDTIDRGKHITTHRELVSLPKGGILIDNPGMREVGVTDSDLGMDITFDKIVSLAQDCKFSDCTHTSEVGCTVLDAVENGEIDPGFLENYFKMQREASHFSSTIREKRSKDKKFGKMYNEVMKFQKTNRGKR